LQQNHALTAVITIPATQPMPVPMEKSLFSTTQFPKAWKKPETADSTACTHGQTVSVAKLVMYVVKEVQQLEIP
jgi:hypothetical protein